MLQERFLLYSNRKQRNKSLIGEYFESGFKKKCCPNVAAPVEIKITLTTLPLLAYPCCPSSLIVAKRVTKCIMFINSP